MTNEAAERLRWEIGSAYRIALLDAALADERKATLKELMAKAERWKAQGMFAESEWGAVMAVLAVTIVNEKEAFAILDAEAKP